MSPQLQKLVEIVWTDIHENCLKKITNRIANGTEKVRYNPQLETRVKSDTSRAGLGVLEQLTLYCRKPTLFTSRFLNSREKRYSVNETELLGVVWSNEYFKIYVRGKQFKFYTKKHNYQYQNKTVSHKSYNSCLARWADTSLQLNTCQGPKCASLITFLDTQTKELIKNLASKLNSLSQN